MIRKTSTKCTTTIGSSTHKKKEEIDGFASISLSSSLQHLVSLCDKIFPLLDKAPSKQVKQIEKCWCGEHHIDKCQIHGSQPFCHDEGDSWNIYRCVKCERVHDSFAYGEHVPYDNYWVTLPIRAMVVLADVLIQDSVIGSGAFLALSNTDEMSEILASDNSVTKHGRTYADGMRQHVQKSNKAGKVVIVNGVETMQHTLFGGRKN